MRRPASTPTRSRWALLVALGATVGAGSRARAAPAAPASDAALPPSAAAPGDAADRDQAEGAAALHAAQELEVQMLELRRQQEALERERASWDDLRRRLDDLEARQAALSRASSDDWTSSTLAGRQLGDGVRFSQDGFVIRSPGDRFVVRPGMRLQSLYLGQLASAGPDDGGANQNASAFRLAHAELLLEGHAVSPRFEYRFELDFADTAHGTIKDAFVQWRAGHAVALRAGQFKVPYGLQTQTWNGHLELVDVAAATSAFTQDRDVGVMVVGRPLAGRLQVQLAAINGPRTPCPPSALRCDAVDLAYAARIVAAPFGPLPVWEGDLERHASPLVQVGVSGAYQLLPTDVRARTGDMNAALDLDGNHLVDNVGVWLAAAELRAVFRGAAVQGEWFGRREHPGAGVADRDTWGAYGEASYFVLPRRLQVLARVGRTDLPLYGATVLERAMAGTRTTEESGGLSAYLRGHDAKLQVDYTHESTPDATSAPGIHRVRAAVQLAY
jgi:Phosphate-selective porin O and P